MSDPARPPRRLPLRFSLRVLLVAVTAFAIGFPIWFRWPYEEEDQAFGEKNARRGRAVQRIVTWQRQWGGGRLKHGPERMYRNGELVSVTTFRNGVLHGPYESREKNGARETGQYANGKKDGVWKQIDPEGNVLVAATWRIDQLDGPYELVAPSGRRRQLIFERGRVTLADGHKVHDRLGELIENGTIDTDLARQLTSQTKLEVANAPIKDFVDFVAIQDDLPVVSDPYHINPQIRVDSDWKGLQLGSALAIISSDHDFGCDYRYGLIWITSADDAKNWRDPTGVADIVPPKDSQLARSWGEPVGVEAIDKPLAEVIDGMIGRLAIAVDASQITPSKEGDLPHLVTAWLRGMPFKHVLGILLYQTRCRCRLEGETLVILPPEEVP